MQKRFQNKHTDNRSEKKVYLKALDRKLVTLSESGSGKSFYGFVSNARGAFPTIVLGRLRALGLSCKLENISKKIRISRQYSHHPELHPLDFEWYFTSKCANKVAKILLAEKTSTICLGAPTVAVAIAKRRHKVVVVDRNLFVANRLPNRSASPIFINADLLHPLTLRDKFHVVFFDAPWYPGHTAFWLWQATQVVQKNGIIAFALFPPLLRPSADKERHLILSQASFIGDVDIKTDFLEYETPLFEKEVLLHYRLQLKDNWRHADFVLIRVRHLNLQRPSSVKISDYQWDTYLLGSQVIKLRNPTRAKSHIIIAPIEGCTDYLLPSVSMRDPRRQQIDLWTSRNRVARVGKRHLISKILQCLSEGKTLRDIMKSPMVNSINIKRRQELYQRLNTFLSMKEEHKC